MDLPSRKQIRLREYDYSQPGYYFVTICTAVRGQNILCAIDPVGAAALGGPPRVALTPAGQAVRQLIGNIDRVYSHIAVDTFVIMPDHVHLILVLPSPEGGSPRAATPTDSIPRVVNTLKGLAVKRTGIRSLWQRGYYEHVIRNDHDLAETRQYIQNNPLNWILGKKGPS